MRSRVVQFFFRKIHSKELKRNEIEIISVLRDKLFQVKEIESEFCFSFL